MSFNVGTFEETTTVELEKLGNAMIVSGADVIGLQELRADKVPSLLSQLATATGKQWYSSSMSSVDEQIISKFPILQQAPAVSRPKTSLPSVWGAQFEFTPGHNAWIFNGHLSPDPYQPYLLRDGTLAKNETAVIASASSVRSSEVAAMLSGINASGAIGAGEPIFITGDFNEPSHLDWTEAAANATARPYDLKVAWPTSSAVANAGFQDSFRVIHADPVAKPGYTWTPGTPNGNGMTPPSANEVHDRIDFIYYRGSQVAPTASKTLGYPDNNPSTDVGVPEYNSDHRAVVSAFTVGGLNGSTLTFSKLSANGALISQAYGDRLITSPNIVASYSIPSGPGEWRFWEEGNWNQGGAAFLDSGGGGQADGSAKYELTLTPDDGFGVLLTGFDLLDYVSSGDASGHVVHWTLKNGMTELFSDVVALVPDNGTSRVNIPMVEPEDNLTLVLQHVSGFDNFLALDNVTFLQVETVSEPSSAGLLICLAPVLWAGRLVRSQVWKRKAYPQ